MILNGYLVMITAMHRRKPHSKCAYARVTDWIAQAGPVISWGRTRREALANLRGLHMKGPTND
jgi:hypothetical protein